MPTTEDRSGAKKSLKTESNTTLIFKGKNDLILSGDEEVVEVEPEG
jgi:NAD(P)H-hydrate repair Nnr-like enzyme with NAD(P)H-hydrate dehydratase domain